METSLNPQFGHYMVRKMQEVDNCMGMQSYGKNNLKTYGVFQIDHRDERFQDHDALTPKDAYKIRLTPVGNVNYLTRDWYVSDVLSEADLDKYRIFDNYAEAKDWAFAMNNIKDVN